MFVKIVKSSKTHVIALCILFAVACSAGDNQGSVKDVEVTDGYISRYEMGQGVVCFVYRGYNKGGISCLQINKENS